MADTDALIADMRHTPRALDFFVSKQLHQTGGQGLLLVVD